MERKLASVQEIATLTPIANADFIEKATVMGWSVVVKKDEFRVGDKCAFFEVDSVLPERSWSEFMRPHSFRVKTAKMRGVLSQGVALPLHVFESLLNPDLLVGTDVTTVLGVQRYEPPPPVSEDLAGPFPTGISKTAELRLQSNLYMLEELRGEPYYITVKCDGMSGTFATLPGGQFVACSRRSVMAEGYDNPFWRVVERYNLRGVVPEGVAVQGEVCGPGTKKNRLGLTEDTLLVFDIFDILDGSYYDFRRLQTTCQQLGLTTVPLMKRAEVPQGEVPPLEWWVEKARGRYEGTKHHREGIVIRPKKNMRCENGERLSFKVHNVDHLLKYGE